MKLEWIDLIIFSLAVFRFTRLIVYDRITAFIRAPFMREYKETNPQGEEEIYLVPVEHGLKGFIGELISCYWCTGIWAAIGIWFFYELVPFVAEPIIIILALAGLAAFIETIIQSKSIGQ